MLLLVLITITGATIMGLIIGIIKQKNLVYNFAKKTKLIKIVSPFTAWDYYFSKPKASWTIITLKSGRTIYGKYDLDSYASSDFEQKDIYIEKVYILNNEKTWIPVERSAGILVFKDDIETIEFFS